MTFTAGNFLPSYQCNMNQTPTGIERGPPAWDAVDLTTELSLSPSHRNIMNINHVPYLYEIKAINIQGLIPAYNPLVPRGAK